MSAITLCAVSLAGSLLLYAVSMDALSGHLLLRTAAGQWHNAYRLLAARFSCVLCAQAKVRFFALSQHKKKITVLL